MSVQPARSPGTSTLLETQLGLDLWTLIDSIGAAVVEAIPVTTIPSPDARRASFRLTLADGRVLKGRRVRTPVDVDRIRRLSAPLDPRFFPPVLAHRGCALLTPWIPGRPAMPGAWTKDLLRTCGRLQATMHRLPVTAEIAPLRRRTVDWDRRLELLLDELVKCDALEVAEAREAYRLAADNAPPAATTAICHTDFCADNIIVTDAGTVCVVDNEGITVDSCEYDLARTWYRWPMTASQERAYADGYGAHGHGARFAAHFLHWALLAVVDSAAYRMRVHSSSATIPLDRLKELLRTRGQGESFPRRLGGG